jgi:hypothetical protein
VLWRGTDTGLTGGARLEEEGTAIRIRGKEHSLLVARDGISHEVFRAAVREAGRRNGSAPFFKATRLPVPPTRQPDLGVEKVIDELGLSLSSLITRLSREAGRPHFKLRASWILDRRAVITPKRAVECALPARLEASASIRFSTRQMEFSFHSAAFMGAALDSLEAALVAALHEEREVEPPEGEVSAVLAPEAAAVFWHEVVGHCLESDGAEISSVLGRVQGAAVAPAGLDVLASASRVDLPGGYIFDDEGQPARDVALLREGCVAGVLTSGQTAGRESNGHGRTSDYRRPPRARISNLIVRNGETEPPELLERCGDGLLVSRVSFGAADPESGRFVMFVEEGRLVRKGKAGPRLRRFSLTGYALDALHGMDSSLGNDAIPATSLSICQKGGDPVPAGAVSPSVLIHGLTARSSRP